MSSTTQPRRVRGFFVSITKNFLPLLFTQSYIK
nr:MAG TPA: hypothetical protein [Caudoviricetes sp.]